MRLPELESRTLARATLGAQPPDPARWWIKHAPRSWPGPELWTDLAQGQLATPRAVDLPALPRPLADVLYVPPVRDDLTARRDRWVSEALGQGTPVLCQIRLGDPRPPKGAVVLHDLLPDLLAGGPLDLAGVPPGAAAVWPLLPGLSDGEEHQNRELARLAAALFRVVQPLALTLTPADRRLLATDREESAYHALFHGDEPAERPFSVRAHAVGLEPFLKRPGARANQRLAEILLLAAELRLRLGRPVSRGLALSRAGRWIDETSYDVEALTRDGNLGIVAELDDESRSLLDAVVAGARPALLDTLMEEYLGADASAQAPGDKEVGDVV